MSAGVLWVLVGRTIHVDADLFQAKMRAGGARTVDDVSVTRDGQRLDSKEAVLHWIAGLEAEVSEGTPSKQE